MDKREVIAKLSLLGKKLPRTLEYKEIEVVCGPDWNSYYKTDKDVTAMGKSVDGKFAIMALQQEFETLY